MQSKTRIHALDQSHHSILTDLFDHIPDALLLVIFNKIGDVRSLGRCACVSKRFNVHIHLVHNVHMKIDQVVSVDGDEAMNLPLPKPQNFLSHFFKLFFNILRPFNHICNCNSGNKTLLPQVSHHSPAQVLNNFTNIQNVTIELPSSDVGTENGVVLKWRAVFGSTLQNCVILGGIRTERKVPDQIVVSDLVEEDNNSSNGVLPESFYTNGGLKLRVVWTINSLIAASTRHYFMQPVIRSHPSLKSLILTDADGQGTLSMGVEQLKEFREKPLTASLSTSRTQVPGSNMKLRYAPYLEVEDGVGMQGATLVAIKPSGGRRTGVKETEAFVSEAFGPPFNSVVDALIKRRIYLLEMNGF